MAADDRLKNITAMLENGVRNIFESGKYEEYLKTMSRFHNYSARNTVLIHLQCPGATYVAGYRAWQERFDRHVRRGETGIRIYAPASAKTKTEAEKIDEATGKPVIGEDGRPVTETVEVVITQFKAVPVFDVSQTEGKELPQLAGSIKGDVRNYEIFMDALRAVSPLPISFEALPPDTDGLYRAGKGISIREGMSEAQTVSAVIHELTHSNLHGSDAGGESDERQKERRTEEITAESVSYAVCQYYGIETGNNSFGYIAGWSKDKELKELNASLDVIRRAAAGLIAGIDGQYNALVKERGIDIKAGIGEFARDASAPSVVADIVPSNADKPQVYTSGDISVTPPPKTGAARELFEKAWEMFPRFMSKEYSYLRLEAKGFEPLSLEWIGKDRFSMMHTYELNGDLCFDPDIVFEINRNAHTLNAVQFQQSIPPVYQERLDNGEWLSVGASGEEHRLSDRLGRKINEFANGWFDNIKAQGHMPVRAVMETGGKGMQIAFTDDGEPVLPEPEKHETEISDERREKVVAAMSAAGYAYDPDKSLEGFIWFDGEHGGGDFESFAEAEEWLEHIGFDDPDVSNRVAAILHPEILKKAVTSEYPYVEVEKVNRYADGGRLDERVFNEGEKLSFAEADAKIKTEEKALRDKNIKKYGSPGDGDEKLSLAVHFKLPGDDEPSVFRFLYLLGDYDEERSGLLKHFEMGADYCNRCIENGDYGNVNVTFGGKTKDDAIRLASEYNKIYETLRDGMAESMSQIVVDRPTPESPATKRPALDLSLPDPAWTQAEMFEYGYTETDMFPLSVGRAVELFDTNHPIYLLYPDNTEALALDKGEIITFSGEGFCGITKADWEMSPVYKAQSAIAENLSANSQAAKESDLLFGDECKFGIYQIKDVPELRDYRFSGNDEMKRLGLRVKRENYDLVYTAPLAIRDTLTNLGRIYEDFNVTRPADFTGRSISLSDVIVLQWRGEVSAHFVDSVGFKELAHFTGNEREQKMTLTEQEAVANMSKAKNNKQEHSVSQASAERRNSIGKAGSDAPEKPGIFEKIEGVKKQNAARAGEHKTEAARYQNAR